MGGKQAEGAEYLNDVFLIDTSEDHKCIKVAEGGPIKFTAWGNQSALSNEDTVSALVEAQQSDGEWKPCIISYTKKNMQIKLVQQLR